MKDESNDGARRKKRLAALIALAVLTPIVVTANWRIAAKAGYRPAFSLLMLVSPLNIFMLLAFAFREWPIQRELRLGRDAARPKPGT